MRKERQHEIIVPRTAFFLLQIRLSNNENIFGTFLSTDLLKDVKRFVDANHTDGKQTYSLAIPFPRKTFCKSGLWILLTINNFVFCNSFKPHIMYALNVVFFSLSPFLFVIIHFNFIFHFECWVLKSETFIKCLQICKKP